MSYNPNNPTTAGRYCPHLRKNCPGTKAGCAFWRVEEVEIANIPRLVENCLFVLHYEATYQSIAEAIRVQAAVQHFNNQVHLTVLALSKGITPPSLSGNVPEDLRMIETFRGRAGHD